MRHKNEEGKIYELYTLSNSIYNINSDIGNFENNNIENLREI